MKTKKLDDLRSKTIEQLRGSVEEKKKVLLKVKVSLATGQQKNLKEGKNLRKDIAQILTIIRQKQIAESGSKEGSKK